VKRIAPCSTASLGSLVAALVVTSVSASGQASTYVGTRAGYDFQTDEVILGANLTVPISTQIEFYPSLELYLPDRGNKIGFNGDVKIFLPTRASYDLYAGGGLGIVNQNLGDVSNTDLGLNLLFGIGSRVGRIHPYGEARLLLHDDTQLVLFAGVNFTLGTR
jgi:hypothetical protein